MDDIMSTLCSRLPDSDAWPEAGNHTIGLLAHLASRHHVPLPASEQKALDCLCRKSDFLGQVRIAYDADWRMALDKRPLPLDAWPVLILSLLVFGAAVDDGTGDGRGRVLKWANSAFNAMELYRSLGGREALQALDRFAEERLQELTVLVHEGPIARTYLEALRSAGMRPARIVLMVDGRDPGTGKPLGRWLPSSWRLKHAARVQDIRFNN